MPSKIHLLFCELMLKADRMHPESVVYEIEELQDRLIIFCEPDTQILAIKRVYQVLADAKQQFRQKC